MTKLTGLFLVTISSLAISACATMNPMPDAQKIAARASLRDVSGHVVGVVELRQRGAEWQLALGVSGQTSGDHGIHLHEVGRCDAPDFVSAKGHLNPLGKAHGSANPAGMHLGDMANLMIGADGTARTVILLPAGIGAAHLFDADGTAIVLHAKADDYRTDPSGNSGGRVACGVLTPA